MGSADYRRLGPCLLVAGMYCLSLHAQTADRYPPIREIVFKGNAVTREETMLREMVVQVGEPADPQAIERSRQAIQDLGLFKEVSAQTEPLDDGVRLTVSVREKWYVLPLPRVEANAEGDYGYGGQLRWNNLWGLNHTARLLFVKRTFRDVERAGQISYSGSYFAPFLAGPRNSLAVAGGHVSQDSIDDFGRHYDETFDSAEVDFVRSLTPGPPSQGWSVGGGWLWQNERARGAFAPASQGMATALVGTLAYNDLHYLIFSEEGRTFAARYEVAQDGWASDYGYSRLSAGFRRAWRLGQVPHQEAQLLSSLGAYFGGAPSRERKAFDLGGSMLMRGYKRETQEGDFYWYLAGEYLRPAFRDWLRVLVLAETGAAYHTLTQTGGRPALASLGLGLRVRVNWLVNLEVEAGVAVPLVRGSGPRLFAGSVQQ